MELTDDIRAKINAMLTAPPARPVSPNFDNRIAGANRGGTGWASTALGVSPDQIGDAREHLRASGVPTDFAPTGEALVTSERHARKIAKASGMFDGRHGYVAPDSDGNPVFTGTKLTKERQHFAAEAKKYAEGERCDPQVARKIEKLAETI